jgi:hypothetical protein
MKHPILAAALAAALVATVSVAAAAPLPTGTIDCQLAGNDDSPYGLRFIPSISSAPSPGRITVKDNAIQGSCDASGVTGGKAPITHVEAKLLGKLAPGTTCLDVITAPHFERIKLKLKWTNVDGTGRKRVVATSAAHNFVGSYDDASEALVFTAQLLRGAFAGSAVTMRLTLDNAAFMAGPCPTVTGIFYGADGESAITVP